MKKIALLLVVLVMVAMMTGCVKPSDEIDVGHWEGRLAKHTINNNLSIIVDTNTGVCYLQKSIPGKGFGMTVLLDSDGTPLLWEEVQHE